MREEFKRLIDLTALEFVDASHYGVNDVSKCSMGVCLKDRQICRHNYTQNEISCKGLESVAYLSFAGDLCSYSGFIRCYTIGSYCWRKWLGITTARYEASIHSS